MLVVGGIDSLAGAVVGVLVISVTAELLARVESGDLFGELAFISRPGMQKVCLGLILVIVLIRRPTGIISGKNLAFFESFQPIKSLKSRIRGN